MPEITKPKVYFTHQITPEALVKIYEQQNGRHILEAAANLGLGSRNYELVNLG